MDAVDRVADDEAHPDADADADGLIDAFPFPCPYNFAFSLTLLPLLLVPTGALFTEDVDADADVPEEDCRYLLCSLYFFRNLSIFLFF